MSTDLVGHFGKFGGRFVPEALVSALDELAQAHQSAQEDPDFQFELMELHRTYTGRHPSLRKRHASAHTLAVRGFF